MSILVPSSSGPGRLVLIQKIVGSTPTGITKKKASSLELDFCLVTRREKRSYSRRDHHFAIRARIRLFFVVNNGEEWKAILLLLSFALETKEGKQRNYYRVASQNYNISRGNLI